LLTKSCSKPKEKTFNYDSVQVKINILEADNDSKFIAIKILEKQIKSFETLKLTISKQYSKNRQIVINNVHDTISVIDFVSDCDSLALLNDSLLINERNINDTLSLVVINQQTMLLDKELIIEQKDIELKQAKKLLRKQKAKKWFNTLIGSLIGFGAGRVL